MLSPQIKKGIIPVETIFVKEYDNSTFYLDMMSDNTFTVSKDENILKHFEFCQEAADYFNELTPPKGEQRRRGESWREEKIQQGIWK